MGLRDRYEFEKERGGHPEGFNIGAMEKIVAAKDAELTTLRQRAEAAERRVAELEGAVEVLVNEAEHFRRFATPHQNEVLEHVMEQTNQNPHAKAAIDAAGGQQ